MPIDLPPSDFTSGDPYRGWWIYTELPVRNYCATQGSGLLSQVQASLHLAAPALAWTPELQQALIARAVELSATQPGWDGVISRLRSDLASATPGTVVGPLSHQFAIYVAYYLPNNRRFDAISLPTNVTLMRWNVPPASDGGLNSGAVVCVDPDRDSPFLNVTAAAVSESATGIRVGPDRPVPPDQVTRPNASIISGGALAALIAVGAVGWWLFTRPRTNPSEIDEEAAARRESRELAEQRFGQTPIAELRETVKRMREKEGKYRDRGGREYGAYLYYVEAVEALLARRTHRMNPHRANPSPLKVTEVDATTVVKTVRGVDKEFEVRIYESGKLREAATYFTMDKDDALGTHDAMVQQIRRRTTGTRWHNAILRPRANPTLSLAQLEALRACRARAAACEESILRNAKPDQ